MVENRVKVKATPINRLQPVFFTIGIFLILLAVMMVAPALLDYAHHDINWEAFAISSAITGFVGGVITLANRSADHYDLSIRDTFILTALAWVFIATFAAFPFILSNTTGSHTDSFFEAVSGLTTTGASVLRGLDYASAGIVLWRSILEWFGGIGIIVMALTTMPILKIGGMQLFRNEFSDHSVKIMPRVSQIAGAIFKTYIFFTFTCVVLLFIAGMEIFDAVCYAFSTISTGGFATTEAGIAKYAHLPSIQIIIMVFMLIGSTSLLLLARFMQGDFKAVFQDSQAKTYYGICVVASLAMTLYLWQDMDFLTALRKGTFGTISMASSTGFNADDYTKWGSFPMVLFSLLLMMGGCTGSTSGGIKIFRFQILYSLVKTQLHHVRRPHGVFVPSYNGKKIPEEVFASVFSFLGLYILSFIFFVMVLGVYNLDIYTCFAAVAGCLSNVAIGFDQTIGPGGDFSTFPDGAKWILMLAMLIGRLEYITLIVMLFPSFWRD